MDMSRYTVGNAANSVNPYTGNKEFFLKKIISGVKKIVKMAAPIVIPLAMNAIFPGMGALASGFIGSGISSLAQGNSFKDSMKAGVMGGVMGGISQGFKNMSTPKGFFSGEGQFSREGFKFFDRSSNPLDTFLGADPINANSMSDQLANPVNPDSAVLSGSGPYVSPESAPSVEGGTGIGTNIDGSNANILDDPNKFSTKLKNFFYDSGSPRKEGLTLQQAKTQIEREFGTSLTPSEVAREATRMVGQGAKDAVKGSYKLFPTIGTGLGLASLAGGFDQIPAEEVEDPYDQESPSQKLLAANPERYTTGAAGAPSYRSLYDVMVPTVRQPIYQQFVEPVQTAAAGGEMQNFPRKTGYIGGPGTETSDSIPAMLSDGEFVMNAKAVRGAGNGSRERGVRKMYDMMRAFEGGAVA